MDNKEKMESQSGTQRANRSNLFACFPLARRKTSQLFSSAILAPHGAANRLDSRHRRRKARSAGKSSIPYSGSIFPKAPTHAGRHTYQEPTSPEVTCVGQVRLKEKPRKAWGGTMALENYFDQKHLKLHNSISNVEKQPSTTLKEPNLSTWSQLSGSRGSISLQSVKIDGTDAIDLCRFSSSCKVSVSQSSSLSRSMSLKTGSSFVEPLLPQDGRMQHIEQERDEEGKN